MIAEDDVGRAIEADRYWVTLAVGTAARLAQEFA